MPPTPAELDRLFPDRHRIAEEMNLYPPFRAMFVPLPSGPLSEEQREAVFPSYRRVPVMRQLVHSLKKDEAAS
jgi:hypothetical protein